MRKYQLGFLILALLSAASLSLARQERKDGCASTGTHAAHLVVTPDQVKWGPAPPSLPPGAQMAVLEGDPSKAGRFTIRAKFPDGYRVPPHWHPTDERIVVLQGTFGMGLGERFDTAAGRELPVESYAVTPKAVRHFVWVKGETVIQVSGTAPFEINYVNPADDPRKASKKLGVKCVASSWLARCCLGTNVISRYRNAREGSRWAAENETHDARR